MYNYRSHSKHRGCDANFVNGLYTFVYMQATKRGLAQYRAGPLFIIHDFILLYQGLHDTP